MSRQGAWIRILQGKEQTPELQELYAELRIPSDSVDNILGIHSLNPDSLRGHYNLYRTLMFGESPLTRTEREMVAVTVSACNHCHY
jgi:hypothetical protein